MKKNIILSSLLIIAFACKDKESLAPVPENALKPTVVTEQTLHDTDDPAVWIHPTDSNQSLIIGTDKEAKTGGLYAFDLEGKLVNRVENLDRPNNVDIAYGIQIGGKSYDIAVTTERNKNQIRIFTLPELKPIDNGGLPVFEGEKENEPMGIALYTDKASGKIYAIVGRKEGPSGTYLFQYELYDNKGVVGAKLVRKFGAYSQKKEIEAIAVDNELGYVYYSDEEFGIRKYYANPEKGDEELSVFGQKDFKRDHEGIAIYKTTETTGYILVSDQQRNYFNVYKREGNETNPHQHSLVAQIPFSTIECDGADAINYSFNKFPNGFVVAMSNGKVFHLYDWKIIQDEIDKQQAK